MDVKLIALSVLAFLIGSVPFSLIVAKLSKNIDIRKVGSKNVGATNVYRTCGAFYGIIAAILDIGKAGIFSITISFFFDYKIAAISSFFVILGHCYPIWLRFKGGKGVATTGGLFIVMNPIFALFVFIEFIIIVMLTKYVSLASLLSGITAVILFVVFREAFEKTLSLSMGVLLMIIQHRGNIKRLINKTERKIS